MKTKTCPHKQRERYGPYYLRCVQCGDCITCAEGINPRPDDAEIKRIVTKHHNLERKSK